MELITCDRCNGTGLGKLIKVDKKQKMNTFEACDKCEGRRNLDWIEAIFGVKKSYGYFMILKFFDDTPNIRMRIEDDKIFLDPV